MCVVCFDYTSQFYPGSALTYIPSEKGRVFISGHPEKNNIIHFLETNLVVCVSLVCYSFNCET